MSIFGMKVKGELAAVKVLTDYQAKLLKLCEEQNDEAIKVWFHEALKHIAEYTGTARGTLVPVGRLVGLAVKRIAPKGNPRRAAQKKFITYKNKKFAVGFSYGESYANATKDTVLERTRIKNIFHYDNNLPYVAYNDVNPAPPGFILPSHPPWWSHDQAVKAWRRYILTKAVKRLPVPRKFVKITKIKVR